MANVYCRMRRQFERRNSNEPSSIMPDLPPGFSQRARALVGSCGKQFNVARAASTNHAAEAVIAFLWNPL